MDRPLCLISNDAGLQVDDCMLQCNGALTIWVGEVRRAPMRLFKGCLALKSMCL